MDGSLKKADDSKTIRIAHEKQACILADRETYQGFSRETPWLLGPLVVYYFLFITSSTQLIAAETAGKPIVLVKRIKV